MARSNKRKKRSSPIPTPYAPPGTLIPLPNAAHSDIQVFAYGPSDFYEASISDPAEIAAYREKWPVTWINVNGLGNIGTIQELGRIFGLHGLALEDVLTLQQRPKAEQYGDHLFLVVRMLESGPGIETEQLSIFTGPGFVLTLQEHPGDCLDPIRKRIREGRGNVRTMEADYLAYCLLDAVIDAYFPALDTLSDRIDDIEVEVLDCPTADTVAQIHQFKRNLLAMRRAVAPLREAVNTMLRDAGPLLSDTTRVHLRDCYDHIIHIVEMVDTYREIIGGLLDIYLSSVSNRMNEIMKVLTIIATIFIPLSFFVGIYGMNFDPDASPLNMPELDWYWGYPAAWAVMILAVAGQLVFFWKQGWIGASWRRPRPQRENHLPSDSGAPPV